MCKVTDDSTNRCGCAISRGSSNSSYFINEELVELVRADVVTGVNPTTSEWSVD